MREITKATIAPAPGKAGAYALPNPLEDLTLRRCTFDSWQGPRQRLLSERVTLRRLTIDRCRFVVSDLARVIVEDTVIDTAWVQRGMWGPQRIHGCLFKRVIVRGRITGGVDVRWAPSSGLESPAEQRRTEDAYARAAKAYYADVDWALDISEAEFTGIELEQSGIPASLVRRDTETQAVVTRQSCGAADWRAACGESALWVEIERFLETPFDDAILIAAKRSKSFARDVAAIGRLRGIGAALPD